MSVTRLERVWGRKGSHSISDVAQSVGGGVPSRVQEVVDVWNALSHYIEVLLAGGRGVAVTCRGQAWCVFRLAYGMSPGQPRGGAAARDGMAFGSSTPTFRLDTRFEERYALSKDTPTPTQCPMVTLTTTPVAEELQMQQDVVRSVLSDIITTIGEGLHRGQTYDLDWGFCRVHLSKRGLPEALFLNPFLTDLRAFDDRREARERKHEFMMAAAAGVHVGGSGASVSSSQGMTPRDATHVERHRLFSPGWRQQRSNVEVASSVRSTARHASVSVASSRQASSAPRASSVPRSRSASVGRGGGGGVNAQHAQQRPGTRSGSSTPRSAFCASAASGNTFLQIAEADVRRRQGPTHLPPSKDPSLALQALKKPSSAAAKRRQKLLAAKRPVEDRRAVAWEQAAEERVAAGDIVASMRSGDMESMDMEVIQEGALFEGSPKVEVRKISPKANHVATHAGRGGAVQIKNDVVSPGASSQGVPLNGVAMPGGVRSPSYPASSAVASPVSQASQTFEDIRTEAMHTQTVPQVVQKGAVVQTQGGGKGAGFLHFPDDTRRARDTRAAAQEIARYNRSMSAQRKQKADVAKVTGDLKENKQCKAAEAWEVQKDNERSMKKLAVAASLRENWDLQMKERPRSVKHF